MTNIVNHLTDPLPRRHSVNWDQRRANPERLFDSTSEQLGTTRNTIPNQITSGSYILDKLTGTSSRSTLSDVYAFDRSRIQVTKSDERIRQQRISALSSDARRTDQRNAIPITEVLYPDVPGHGSQAGLRPKLRTQPMTNGAGYGFPLTLKPELNTSGYTTMKNGTIVVPNTSSDTKRVITYIGNTKPVSNHFITSPHLAQHTYSDPDQKSSSAPPPEKEKMTFISPRRINTKDEPNVKITPRNVNTTHKAPRTTPGIQQTVVNINTYAPHTSSINRSAYPLQHNVHKSLSAQHHTRTDYSLYKSGSEHILNIHNDTSSSLSEANTYHPTYADDNIVKKRAVTYVDKDPKWINIDPTKTNRPYKHERVTNIANHNVHNLKAPTPGVYKHINIPSRKRQTSDVVKPMTKKEAYVPAVPASYNKYYKPTINLRKVLFF